MANLTREQRLEREQAAALRIESMGGDPEQAALADEAKAQEETAALEALAVPFDPNAPMTAAMFMQMMQAMKGPSATELAEIVVKATQAGADRIKTKELTIAQTDRRSAFNPEGEKANPRPKLKCPMYFGGAPIGSPKEVTTLTHREIAALNLLTPGHYGIVKLDGSKAIIEVRGQLNSNQELDRIWIRLPEGDDQQNLYPSLAVLCESCTEENRKTPVMVG